MISVITLHGINTFHQDYADSLTRSLWDIPNIRTRSVYWGHHVKPYLDASRRRFYGRPIPWWRPISRLRRSFINFAQQSMEYSLLYLEPDIQRKILDTIEYAIREEVRAGSDQFVFVAHSLGTMAIYDTLVRMQEADRLPWGETLDIITMGCPIAIFPHSDIRKVNFKNQWLNLLDVEDAIARPLSPLDLRVSDKIISTGGILSAHEGYWNSSTVHGIVHECLDKETRNA